jgi:hypothetical protein
MIPIPVRRSRFVPLVRGYAPYNVETAAGSIGAFGAALRRGRSDVALCDLQDNPDTTVLGRLGSGRAGVYRGKYLKGIGRTLLAGNWARPDDVVHHTGHLSASAAVRELLVSAYLEAKGCSDAINPCESVLVGTKAPVLRSYLAERLRKQRARLTRGNPWSSDLALQAISVKPAGFARYSNLIWMVRHLDLFAGRGTHNLTRFVELFSSTVDPKGRVADPTPDDVAQAFVRSVERGLDHLHRFWRLGVSWISLHNNFTADGRFLDLEAPVIVGTPLVGVIGTQPHRRFALPHSAALSGLFEPMAFVLHMRMIAWSLRSQFEAIFRAPNGVSRTEREFAHGLSMAFVAATRGHILFSRRLLKRRLLGWVEDTMELGRSACTGLIRTLDAAFDVYLDERQARPELGVRALELQLARGQSVSNVAHVFDFMEPVGLSDDARLFNQLVSQLDTIADRDRFLVALGEATRQIKTYCR